MKAAIIMLALLCAGCEPSTRQIMTDDATNCTYWKNSTNTISPRMGADGKQICRKVAK